MIYYIKRHTLFSIMQNSSWILLADIDLSYLAITMCWLILNSIEWDELSPCFLLVMLGSGREHCTSDLLRWLLKNRLEPRPDQTLRFGAGTSHEKAPSLLVPIYRQDLLSASSAQHHWDPQSPQPVINLFFFPAAVIFCFTNLIQLFIFLPLFPWPFYAHFPALGKTALESKKNYALS